MDQKLSGTRSRTCVRAPKAIILNGNFRRRKAGTVFGRDCVTVAAKQRGPEISLSGFLWLYRVKNGLTALPEPWDARTDHSHNHLMLGHLQEWFYAQVGGEGYSARPHGRGLQTLRRETCRTDQCTGNSVIRSVVQP